MLPLAYSAGLFRKLYHCTWLFFFLWKCMVREVRFILSEGWFESLWLWLMHLKGQKIMQYLFFIYIYPSLTVSVLPFLWGFVYAQYKSHCWIMWTLAWRHTYEDIVIQYTVHDSEETHAETGCLIPAEARLYFYRIKRHSVPPNLVKLSYLRVCVNILNHSRNWVFECAKRKKYRTKLFDTRTITKNNVFSSCLFHNFVVSTCKYIFKKFLKKFSAVFFNFLFIWNDTKVCFFG